MKIRLQLFALARQLAGHEFLDLDLPEGSTIADLRRALRESAPALAPVVGHLMFAINADYASDSSPIPPTADLACIPPVSGG
jgi:molybdopterin converting factor small subunit